MTRTLSDQPEVRVIEVEIEAPAIEIGPTDLPALATAPDFAVFMITTATCPACRLMKRAVGLPEVKRLHVRRAGKLLSITDADDLHQIGASLVAEHAMDFHNVALFRLLSQLPQNIHVEHFQPATGMVTLGLCDGHWTLCAVGRAEDPASTLDHIHKAKELKD